MRVRQTKQRSAILKAFELEKRPLAVEDVHSLAKQDCPNLGITTVYRNLQELCKEQSLICTDYPGQPTLYETFTGIHHSHFICNDCNKVFAFNIPTPDVEKPQLEAFKTLYAEVLYYGECKNCQAKIV